MIKFNKTSNFEFKFCFAKFASKLCKFKEIDLG